MYVVATQKNNGMTIYIRYIGWKKYFKCKILTLPPSESTWLKEAIGIQYWVTELGWIAVFTFTMFSKTSENRAYFLNIFLFVD